MPRKPRTFDQYKDEYPHIRMERSEEGILLMQLHNGEGGEFEWSFDNHHEVGFSWRDVGADVENKVIILTGSADAFLRREYLSVDKVDREGMEDPASAPSSGSTPTPTASDFEMDLLEIEQPMIAALNGPCTIHAEIPLLCDIVLAAEHTVIGDHVHFSFGLVPGDGVQALYPLLMGLNRARYFMLTGQELSAQECLDLGLVNEVLPQDQVLRGLRARAVHPHAQANGRPPLPTDAPPAGQAPVPGLRQPRSDDRGHGLRRREPRCGHQGSARVLRSRLSLSPGTRVSPRGLPAFALGRVGLAPGAVAVPGSRG